MRTSFYFLLTVIILLTGVLAAEPAPASAQIVGAPVRLVIPSIGINTAIQGIGLTRSGNMAVPSGSTNNVGWYKYGVVPGQKGSAVLDAHVFAAFSKLKYVKPGADVYVVTAANQKLHFVVSAKQTFALSKLSSDQLFRPTASHALNLITCAGSLTADHSTYDHRLIVYATLEG